MYKIFANCIQLTRHQIDFGKTLIDSTLHQHVLAKLTYKEFKVQSRRAVNKKIWSYQEPLTENSSINCIPMQKQIQHFKKKIHPLAVNKNKPFRL